MARRKQSATIDLKVRMKEPLRASLEREARKRGISLNAEAVDRLERSFEREGLLSEILSGIFGSKEIAGIALALGETMATTSMLKSTYRFEPGGKVAATPDNNVRPAAFNAARLLLDVLEKPECARGFISDDRKLENQNGLAEACIALQFLRRANLPKDGFPDYSERWKIIRDLLPEVVKTLQSLSDDDLRDSVKKSGARNAR